MKKILAVAALVLATSASALTVNGSKHDMGVLVPVGSTDVCYYCHAAHNTTAAAAPLWARAAWLGPSSYQFYTSSTISVNAATLDVVSQACMTCHDGAVAVNETIKGTYGSPTVLTGTALVSQDLRNDHPVNLVWAVGKAGLNDGSNITPFKMYATSGGPAGISCASCHQVHDNANGKFLRQSLTAGDFCAKCHSLK